METDLSVDIDDYMDKFVKGIKEAFHNRVEFIGLQGSRSRNEHTPESDIDTVVILDRLNIDDLIIYDRVISSLMHRDKACGFISGRKELINWEKSELCQFYHDTVPYYGNMNFILVLIKSKDIKRSMLTGACAIYHMCCHNFIHEKDKGILLSLLKSASIVIQAKHYCKSGEYIKDKYELAETLDGLDREIMEIYILSRAEGTGAVDLYETSDKLMRFSAEIINSIVL